MRGAVQGRRETTRKATQKATRRRETVCAEAEGSEQPGALSGAVANQDWALRQASGGPMDQREVTVNNAKALEVGQLPTTEGGLIEKGTLLGEIKYWTDLIKNQRFLPF
ncbi:Protein of unknown function [Gryllus bimaculatus]|nr:Protein of unknown function [Gryllus bimaculatus]